MSRPWLLAGGMLAGAALAVFYIVRIPDAVEPTADAVAWVNDRPISRASYENALQAVAGDRKSGTLREDDRERVLQRLIDQELLIDRAIEIGLPERDPQIRNQLATAMIAFLVRRAEDEATAERRGSIDPAGQPKTRPQPADLVRMLRPCGATSSRVAWGRWVGDTAIVR